MACFAVNEVTHSGQPALLYLDPACVGSALALGAANGQLGEVWNFKEEGAEKGGGVIERLIEKNCSKRLFSPQMPFPLHPAPRYKSLSPSHHPRDRSFIFFDTFVRREGGDAKSITSNEPPPEPSRTPTPLPQLNNTPPRSLPLAPSIISPQPPPTANPHPPYPQNVKIKG